MYMWLCISPVPQQYSPEKVFLIISLFSGLCFCSDRMALSPREDEVVAQLAGRRRKRTRQVSMRATIELDQFLLIQSWTKHQKDTMSAVTGNDDVLNSPLLGTEGRIGPTSEWRRTNREWEFQFRIGNQKFFREIKRSPTITVFSIFSDESRHGTEWEAIDGIPPKVDSLESNWLNITDTYVFIPFQLEAATTTKHRTSRKSLLCLSGWTWLILMMFLFDVFCSLPWFLNTTTKMKLLSEYNTPTTILWTLGYPSGWPPWLDKSLTLINSISNQSSHQHRIKTSRHPCNAEESRIEWCSVSSV